MNYFFSHSITPIPAQLSEVIHFPATPMQVLSRRKEKDRSGPDLCLHEGAVILYVPLLYL